MSKPTNTSRALSALLAIPLLGSVSIFGAPVTRCSLLGYLIGAEVMEAESAAELLASLLLRVRSAVSVAAARLKVAGLRGTFRIRASETPFGLPQIVVTPRCEGADFPRDEIEARRAAAIACREAGLYADVAGRDVFVVA
jgi:hypothetical protein